MQRFTHRCAVPHLLDDLQLGKQSLCWRPCDGAKWLGDRLTGRALMGCSQARSIPDTWSASPKGCPQHAALRQQRRWRRLQGDRLCVLHLSLFSASLRLPIRVACPACACLLQETLAAAAAVLGCIVALIILIARWWVRQRLPALSKVGAN